MPRTEQKQQSDNGKQLSFDQMLDRNPGKALPVPADADDIGGELLSILSKGLYTNPLDCIREYAQNGVDAGAKNITIKITGRSVSILDDGAGMEREDLLQAKKVGLSPKSIADNVGFRGIGVYSGFDLCRELSIRSTKRGSKRVHTLIFKFADMKAQLDKERLEAGTGKKRTPLVELLRHHVELELMPEAEDIDTQYTLVTLQELSPEHLALLSNRSSLRNYLLANLPIDFAADFSHAATVDKHLYENVNHYRSVRVIFQLPGQKSEVVEKYSRDGGEPFQLQAPQFEMIRKPNGDPVAYYWVCQNIERRSVDASRGIDDDAATYAGLIYKVKGFSIGSREKLRELFDTREQVYPWFTGEIYVIDPAIVPNAERNDFEVSAAKQFLLVELGKLADRLIQRADAYSRTMTAREAIEKFEKQVQQYDAQLRSDVLQTPLGQVEGATEALRNILNLLRELPKRKKVVAGSEYEARAQKVLERARRLRDRLDVQIKTPQETVRRKRQATKEGSTTTPAAVQDMIAVQEAHRTPTLRQVFEEAGWVIEGKLLEMLNVFQSALDDLLGANSSEHRRIVRFVSEKVSEDRADE